MEREDREDLLREATALVQRVELTTPRFSAPIVIGFRRNNAVSFFFGFDIVDQFNAAGEWRRGHDHGRLLKADRAQIAELRREPTDEASYLVRRDLSPLESESYLDQARQRLFQLESALSAGDYQIIGQVPTDADIIGRIQEWLAQLPAKLTVAVSPRT